MNFYLECKKMKRTGFHLSFLCGGLLAAAVPILNLAVRSEMYLGLDDSPVGILMNANWQMMAMLNLLLAAAGACLMYHTEYADGAIQKMCTLPVKESWLFFGKLGLMAVMCFLVLAIEAVGTAFCLCRWFELSEEVWIELLGNFGYALLLMLPAAAGFLLIASGCRNMWVSLGISVVCIFAATMMPVKNFILSLFPFAMSFQTFSGTAENVVVKFVIAAITEFFVIVIAEILFLKFRRWFT